MKGPPTEVLVGAGISLLISVVTVLLEGAFGNEGVAQLAAVTLAAHAKCFRLVLGIVGLTAGFRRLVTRCATI